MTPCPGNPLLNLSINCAITGASWRAHILMDMKVLQFMTNPFHKIIVHTGCNNILICISHCLNILFCSMSKDHSQVRSIVTAALEICLQDFQSIASKRIWGKKIPTTWQVSVKSSRVTLGLLGSWIQQWTYNWLKRGIIFMQALYHCMYEWFSSRTS